VGPLKPLPPQLARQRIVFTDECAGPGLTVIHSIRLDGRGLRRLAVGGSDPSVSADRTMIAYPGEPPNSIGGIYVERADARHARVIDREKYDVLDGQPSWSPDDRKLVFVQTVSPAPSGGLFQSSIYVINRDGSDRRRILRSLVDFPEPSWINARQILLTYKWGELAVVSARTGRPLRLIRLPNKGTQPGDGPKLSPNGREIAVGECNNADCSFESVDVITLAGKLLRRIRGAHTPDWTPSSGLLYACCQQAGIRGETSRIIYATPRGSRRPVTPVSLSADQPHWLGTGVTRRKNR
jgi:WD40-like Beta Propeller Repeat